MGAIQHNINAIGLGIEADDMGSEFASRSNLSGIIEEDVDEKEDETSPPNNTNNKPADESETQR